MPLITIPAYPPAPQSIEIMQVAVVGMNISPFTGQQQTYDWQAQWKEAVVTMPPMNYANAQNWVTFLEALKGVLNTFQFTAAFQSAYPLDIPGGVTWRLKQNSVKWSITRGKIYQFSFEIRQVI